MHFPHLQNDDKSKLLTFCYLVLIAESRITGSFMSLPHKVTDKWIVLSILSVGRLWH